MSDSTGQSAPDHEGTDPPKPDPMKEIDTSKIPLAISEDQLSVYIANTAHLVLHKLRKEMRAQINKEVARLRIDHEKRWRQIQKQLRDYVRVETVM